MSRRHVLPLAAALVAAAVAAQIAGVGTHRASKAPKRARAIAVVPGGMVPDVTSTSLASTSVKARAGETVRMSSTATIRATRLPRDGVAQVVCGIRYSRAGDPAWTLGVPYETVTIRRTGVRSTVKLSRSFEAPSRDTYRMSSACHVASPERGARVVATGTMRGSRGLPKGAAKPS